MLTMSVKTTGDKRICCGKIFQNLVLSRILFYTTVDIVHNKLHHKLSGDMSMLCILVVLQFFYYKHF